MTNLNTWNSAYYGLNNVIRNFGFISVLSLFIFAANAQPCLTPTACTGTPISGSANVTIPAGTTYYVPTGQTFSGNITFATGTATLCVQGTFTGDISGNPPAGATINVNGVVNSGSPWSFSGGGATINIFTGASFTVPSWNTTGGTYTMNNCGTFTTTFDLFNNGGVVTINNYGVVNVKGTLTSANPNFTFNNKATGTMYVGVNFSFSAGIYINDGDFCVKADTHFSGGAFTNNKCLSTTTYNISGSNAFTNNYSITINGNYTNSGTNTINNGSITLTGNFTNSGGFVLGSGSLLSCVNWTNSGTLTGSAAGCGSFRISGVSQNTGTVSAANSGMVDIYDVGNPAPMGTPPARLDFNNGNVNSATFTGTCTVNSYPACTVSCPLFACPDVANAGPDQTVCATTATLAGNAATTGNGTWVLISGAGTITSPNSPTSGVTGLGVGANMFRWTIGCNTSKDSVIITRVASPTTSVAGADQTICATSTTLAGNTAAIGTGTWTLISGSGTITNPSSPTSGLTGLGVGANVFRWTIANPPCPASTDDVTITVKANPTVANAGPDQNICNINATLAGNTATIGTGTWTRISGAGTITSPNSPNSGITGLGVGANVFRWTISNPPCASTSDDVTINVSATPSTADAGPDQTLCNVTTATLSGNTPVSGTGSWSLVSGSGTITSPLLPNSGVTGLGVGANVFRWTINGGACANLSDDVVITIKALPTTSEAGPNQTLCITNNSTILAGINPTVGTGTWTLISGSGTITTPSSPTSVVTGLGVGANVFRWTISNPPCASSSSDVTITVSDLPTVAVAGPDQTLCITGNSTTLAGNSPIVGAGIWSLVSGSGSITSPSSPTSGVTGLGLGANVFRWTISSSPCVSTTDDVTITVIPSTSAANAGPDQTLCANSTTLAGNTPTVGTGTWTLISGTGTIVIANPSNPTTALSGFGVGSNVFRWTITNPPCASTFDEVTINVSSVPTTADAGQDQTICSSSTALAGNTPTSGTGTWTLISGSGSIASPSSPNSGVNGLAVGSNVFRWTINNAPCPVSYDEVTIIVKGLPTTANAGSDQTICISTNSTTLAGNVPTVGTGTWTLVSGSGTITTPSSPTSGVTGLGLGANVFRWTIDNSPCPSSSDVVTINVNNVPTVSNAGPDQSVCITSPTAILAGNTPTVGTGTWTLISGSGTLSSPTSPNSGVTGLGLGANVFRWTISNPPCASSTNDVTINVNNVPTVSNAGPDQNVCITSPTATLAGNTPTVGTGTWTLISGTGTISAPTSPTSGVTGLGLGNNVFRWTISNPPCASSTNDVTIIVKDIPTVSNAGPDQSLCSTGTNLAGNVPVTGTGTWTLISGTGTITTPTSPTSGVTGLGVGNNVFRWTISNPPCASTFDEVTITVSPNPTTSNAGPDQIFCSTVTTATLAGNTPAAGTGTWSLVSGTGTITNPALPNSGVTGLTIGANVFRWTINSGACANVKDDITITISAPVTISAVKTNVNCYADNTGAINITVTGGTLPYTYSWSNTGTTEDLTGLTSGTYSVVVTDRTGCTGATSVTITQPPAPLDFTSGFTNVSCKGSSNGTASVSATGGTPAYTYLWFPSGGTASTASGLAGGSYTVTVTDVRGCVKTAAFSINESATLLTAGITNNIPVTCKGSKNGTLTVTPAGGTTPYTYSWSPAGGTSSTASGLSGGNYTVTVTDVYGCDTVITAKVDESTTRFSASITNNTPVTCKGSSNGTLTVTPAGGTLPYVYSWSPAAGPVGTLSGLSGGTYSVTITDKYGCDTNIVAKIFESATLLTANIANTTPVTCKGSSDGSIVVSTAGGTTPYAYSWTPSGGPGMTASGLPGGVYTIAVSDSTGCKTILNATVNESTDLLTASVTNIKAVTCKGSSDGTGTVAPLGGTAPYTYSWSPSGGTSAIATGLSGGTYTVLIADAYGCDTAITLIINESATPLITNISSTDAGCAGNTGTVSVVDSGGTGPITYQWSPSVSTTNSATGLAPGAYIVTVTDLYGCTSILTTNVNARPTPKAGFTPSPVVGTNPLTVNFANTSTGGTYYQWFFGDGAIDSTFSPSHIYDNQGNYTVKLIVINSFGCVDSAIYTFIKVTQKSMISVPNVFTPNGDIQNDIFYITSKGLETLQVEIYNRWGMKLYEFDTVNGGWDGRTSQGTEAPDGTYYYILKANGVDGEVYNMQGFLTLIR